MAQTIKLKRSATAGAAPTTSQLELGEVAINTYDGKMYIKKSVAGTESIVEISGAGGAEAIFVEYLYTATASQTAFSGNDDNSAFLSYEVGAIQVFLNGILLDPETDYTATNGALITLASAAAVDDYLQIFAFKKKISDGNVTVDAFSGNNSTTAFTLTLDPGDENNTRVFIDGVYQSKSNYTVSGTTLTFSTAPPSGTAIEVEIGNRVVTLDTLSDLDLPDNVKLRLGTSQDLEIYHDASDSLINDNGTGSLKLQTGGSTKLEVTSTGVDVTGNIAVSGTVDGIDIAARDAVLTSTTTTAGAALPRTGGAMTGAITTNSTFDGRDVATDGAKLDGIESGATADQTQSEINALGITATGLSGTPAISVANITTTGELRGPASFTIDPAAVGDNTGTVIIKGNLQVDGATTTINSTTLTVDDLNLTLASGAANGTAANGAGITIDGASATLTYQSTGDNWAFNKNLDVTGNIVVSGTVDGRDVATDGTKLDTIEPSSTADQTGAEIKALYEAETNAYTDTLNTKLNAIEALADVTDTTNVTAAGALMDSEVTNLAQVKAFDSSDYATAAQGTTADAALPKAGGTMTGGLSIRGFNGPVLKLGSSGTSDPRIDFEDQNSTNLGAGIFLDQDADTLRILRTVSGSATDGIAINASGKVGIGTDDPVTALHVDPGYVTLGTSTGTDNSWINNVEDGNLELVNEGRSTNDGAVRINRKNNPAGDTTYFRDTVIYDGKSNVVLFVDGSEGSVGIGTDAPNTTLTLSDGTDEFDFGVTTNLLMIKSVTADGSDDQRIIIDAGNGGTTSTRGAYLALSGNEAASEPGKAVYQMGNVTGSAHLFRKAGGVDAVTIDSSGKVLIGDTASHTTDLLQIETPASGGGHGIQIRRNDANNDQGIGHILFGNNTATDLVKISAKTDGDSNAGDSGALMFSTQVTGGNLTERLRIDSSGNVGIGTIDPQTRLDVESATAGTIAKFFDTGSNGGAQYNGAAVVGISRVGNGTVSLAGPLFQVGNDTSSSTAYNIDEPIFTVTNASVGIGTDNPTAMLQVGNSVSGETGLVIFNSEGGNQSGLLVKSRTNRATLQVSDNDSNAFVQAEGSHAIYGQHSSLASADMTIDAPGNMNLQNGSYYVNQVRHSVRPSLNLDFANSKELDSRITFYRDSIATYYDSKGVLKYANVNEPRFDHDPATGESKGLLIEEARAGLNTNTVTINGGYWGFTNATATIKQAIAPDGTYSADGIHASTSNDGHGIYKAFVPTANTYYTLTGYYKRGANRYVSHAWYYNEAAGSTNYPTAYYDLDNGTFTHTTGINRGTTMTDVGNGWYRCSLTVLTDSTPSSSYFYATSATADGTAAYVGTGAIDTYYWGLQIEIGAFPTSFIPSDTRFTSRSSTATYHDETGILRTAPVNGARYGYKYDGRKWVETGLILEAAGTNMLYHSTKGSDLYGDVLGAEALWTITDSSTDVTAPDGSLKTTKGVSGTSGNSWYWQVSPFSYTNGTTYTHSAWVRTAAGTTGTIAMNVYPQTLANGSPAATSITATDEWQRVSVTFPYNSSTANPYIGFVSPQYSRTFYFWGWQIEAHSGPTSYIKTLGSAVTRAADVASSVAYTREEDVTFIGNLAKHDFLEQSEGTLFFEASTIVDSDYAYNSFTLSLSSETTSPINHQSNDDLIGLGNNMGFGSSSGNASSLLWYINDASISGDEAFGNAGSGAISKDNPFKMALAYETNNAYGYADGTKVGATDTSVTIPTTSGINMMIIGGGNVGRIGSGNPHNGHVRKVSYYTQRLSEAEIQALTENN